MADGVMVCLLAGSNCPLARAMDGHIMRCGTIGSCQSAATSEIVKALLVTSVTHVSGAITSVLTFNFTFQMVPFSMTLSDLYPTFQGDDNIQCQITRLIVNHV